MSKIGITAKEIHKFSALHCETVSDLLVVEEPLEIRLRYGNKQDRQEMNLAITMRTPGHDFELTLGFLFTEGIIQSKDAVQSIKYCVNPKSNLEVENIVKVELAPNVQIDPSVLQRNFYVSSSCGVCGKSSIEAAMQHCSTQIIAKQTIPIETLYPLPENLRKQQIHFKHTGGLHACAFFNKAGELSLIREDVGRHNALDKLIGAHLSLNEQAPFGLLLSGRISFELVQKASKAGVQVICAIGAPSSLAVEMAQSNQITLVGFLKNNQFNCYTYPERLG